MSFTKLQIGYLLHYIDSATGKPKAFWFESWDNLYHFMKECGF